MEETPKAKTSTQKRSKFPDWYLDFKEEKKRQHEEKMKLKEKHHAEKQAEKQAARKKREDLLQKFIDENKSIKEGFLNSLKEK